MNQKDNAIIAEYLTEDEPFGPIDAKEVENQRALELLFEHHNKIYKALHRRPSIVVGRKGSGKTSYLNSVFFDTNYAYVAKTETAEAFESVINSISSISGELTFAESYSKVWESVLYIGLFNQIRKDLPKSSKSKKFINDYLAKIGIHDGGTLDDVLWKITDVITEKAGNKPHGIIAEILRRLDDVTFKETKEILIDELKSTNTKAVILLDSLDDFKLHIEAVGPAIQGLLKFAGESNKPSTPIDIRLCLPSELYHVFVAVSSNPINDFKRKLVLHWIASELVMVAAHRLSMFIEVNDYNDRIPVSININDKKSARVLLESVLPQEITCKLGIKEDPLAYILRHTQLLPRHLLMILNSIYDKNKKYNTSGEFAFTEEAIRKGISAVEETLVQEIFVAYKPVHPNAKAVCNQCIPELFNKFSNGDLEIVFRTHGKKAMGTDDFNDFKGMLIEIGAIGRVLEDQGRYIQAEFEYTVPHKLVTSSDDMLCFHPIFAEIFSAKIRENKPVYPYGSLIEDRDYRQYI